MVPPPRHGTEPGSTGAARADAVPGAVVADGSTACAGSTVVVGAVTARLAGVAAELGAIVAEVDAGSVLATEAVGALAELDRISRLAGGGRLKLAARAAEAGFWKTNGDRSAAEWLAGRAGCGVREARGLLSTSEKLADLPQVAQAVGRGELSLDQAVAVADGAAANPAAEAELLATARRESLQGLRTTVDRVKQDAVVDEAAQQRAIHRTRHHRMWASGGGVNWAGRHTADAGARMKALLGPFCQAVYDDARARGEREEIEAYMADALMLALEAGAAYLNGDTLPAPTGAAALAKPGSADRTGAGAEPDAATPPGADVGGTLFAAALPPPSANLPAAGSSGTDPPPRSALMRRLIEGGHLRCRGGDHLKVIVRVDATALDRGGTAEGEVCEVAGIGPVPVPAVRELMADAALAVVLTRGTDVVRVANPGRSPNALQNTVLQWRDRMCSVAGCTRTARLETDHITEWSKDGPTSLDNLERKCAFHHALKSRDGWTEEPGPAGSERALLPRGSPSERCHTPRLLSDP
jgi:hypothetical protein